jgi:hypothetical protein
MICEGDVKMTHPFSVADLIAVTVTAAGTSCCGSGGTHAYFGGDDIDAGTAVDFGGDCGVVFPVW